MAQLKFPAQQAALLVEIGAAPLIGSGNWLEHLPVPYLGYQVNSPYWVTVGVPVVGDDVGFLVVGEDVGFLVGAIEGVAVGLLVGAMDGVDVGLFVGALDGVDVVGEDDGLPVGAMDGVDVGLSVGALDGDAVGGLTMLAMQ